MATIKKNSPSTSSHRTQKSQRTQKPNQTRQNQKPGQAKKPDGESFKASDELRENRHHGRHRDKKADEAGKNGKADEAGKNGEQDKRLEDKLSDLEKQLADLKNQPKAEAQQPQNSGGCCGGGEKGGGDKAEQSKGAKAADPTGQQNGPDGELQNLAAQVMQASGMLGGQPGAPGMPGQFPGQPPAGGQRPGVQGIQGARGPANPQAGQLKGTLAQKAQQYAKQGFQPQPATRVLVQGALGYDPFQNPGMPQNGGNPLAPGNAGFPNPQPFGGFGQGVRVA